MRACCPTVAARVCVRIALQLKLGAPAEKCGRRPGQEPGRRARPTHLDTWSHAVVSAVLDALNEKIVMFAGFIVIVFFFNIFIRYFDMLLNLIL